MTRHLLTAVVTIFVIAIGIFWITKMNDHSGLWASRSDVAQGFIRVTTEAITQFHSDVGRYPTQKEGLEVLLSPPSDQSRLRWQGPYLDMDKIPADTWEHAYVYIIPGSRSGKAYDLYSFGPDGVLSADDIGNW